MAKIKFEKKGAFEREEKKAEELKKVIELKTKNNDITEVKINEIINPVKHDRVGYSKETVSELAISLKEVGQLQPVVLRRLKNGELERIIGFRRILAAKELNWDSIKAIILDNVSDHTAALMMLTENMHREDPNLYDQTIKIIEYVSIFLGKSEEELKKLLFKLRNYDSGQLKELTENEKEERAKIEIALEKTVKISIVTLVDRLRIFNLDEVLIKSMREEHLSYANAIELNKIKDEKYFLIILKKTIEEKLSKNELKKIIKEYKDASGGVESEDETVLFKKIKSINLKKIKKKNEIVYNEIVEKMKDINTIIENL